ncbi:putative nuclease HARBI1 [Temnothorax curvispinosus]|uniref:Nuclease HARBI1 n=1 Tax=Temnothorax curvispinosus TaxID=300111 RepID=A0A6J1PDI8_9HYME|nr:putative nuclease HARBI1 [Temnothorax curvispinosus]
MTPLDRAATRNKFARTFPGAIGAIDCTYINIIAPRIHEEAYVNHHGNHSLNVQAIVDPDLKILNINARYPGARNDAFIWNSSPIKHVMEHFYNHGERRTYLINIAGQIVNACAILHNMRLYYRLPLDMEENVFLDNAPADHTHVEEEEEVEIRRGPRAVAQRIQKQLMQEWFPNYVCAWDNE